MPTSGGRGWLVTYQHGERGVLGQGMDVEARAAVMRGQWGWALYAVQECRAGQKVGWYEGEMMSAVEWDRLGRREGYEHTVRVSHTGGADYVNGIDGVAGMQYADAGYGRVERERETGRPEQIEKVRISLHEGRASLCVKKGARLMAGEEVRWAYGWTKKAWDEAKAGGERGSWGGLRRRSS